MYGVNLKISTNAHAVDVKYTDSRAGALEKASVKISEREGADFQPRTDARTFNNDFSG